MIKETPTLSHLLCPVIPARAGIRFFLSRQSVVS
jgi:hypothetical protein